MFLLLVFVHFCFLLLAVVCSFTVLMFLSLILVWLFKFLLFCYWFLYAHSRIFFIGYRMVLPNWLYVPPTEATTMVNTGSGQRSQTTMTAQFDGAATRWLVECCFTSTETIGLLGTGAQDGHLRFHTAPELCGDPLLWSST